MKINKYIKTRERVKRTLGNNISDRDIIEYLATEIEQYRYRIEEQMKHTEEQSEETIDKDIKEITTTIMYAQGRLIKSITDYKY